ncbi:DMT family transporter [Cognatishimia sp. SS12]|uniref:DMT family transporter n=1 Tax=Cognatishimia sp. SS12 TaxID=2979465 RepID=UPI00232CAE63|nr:DMT family transporter [Cognatishimia sp. SS12]MDC0738240.1 DMT family transporter [Cognatishimia sp. SS12]
MLAAMAGFAAEDALLKSVAQALPIGQLMVLFGLGGALCFAALARHQGAALFLRDVRAPIMQLRFGFEFTGRLFYVLAIALTPLSAATVILQAAPLVVVAGAAIFLGETVGWRRWTAIALGLLGVLVIIQPGAESFTPLSLLAVLGMLGFAGRDLASRVAPKSLGTATLGFYGFLTIVLAGLAYGGWQGLAPRPLSAATALALLGAILVGVASYSCLMKAMRTGDVSAVTPFRYSRLIFGVALGLLFFKEQLTPEILLGSGLIVLAGLFILWRGRAA